MAAQTLGTGSIQGTVTDQTGSLVPNATVTVVDPATGRTVTSKTSNRGTYTVPALPPATYTVTASAAGFENLLQQNVAVAALATVTVDLQLKIGQTNETVTVSAIPPQLDTVNGTLEVAIPHDTYESLPVAMNGSPMSPLGFVDLAPGVSAGGNATIVLNGSAGETSGMYINGMPATNPQLGGDRRLINEDTALEAVKDFQIISSGVPAYYSGGGVINLVMKSGTDQFHGDVYENIRNTVFDAAGYFSAKTPVERQNEYGATFSGPILKKRLFFFFNYDGFKYVAGSNPKLYSLPTLAERHGDFSALPVPIYDPATTKCVGSKCTASQFPGNIIPASRISAVSSFFQSFLPPTINSSLQSNYLGAFTPDHTQNTYFGKLDFAVTKTNNLTFSAQNGYLNDLALPVTGGGTQLPVPYASARYAPAITRLFQIQDTQIVTPNLLNVFGYQVIRFDQLFISPTNSGTWGAAKAGITGIPGSDASNEFPPISFAGPNAPTVWAAHPQAQNGKNFITSQVFQDNVQWVHGKHNLTVGGELRFAAENAANQTQLNTTVFSNRETAGFINGALAPTQGNAYASFLLGDVDSSSLTDSSIAEAGIRSRRYSVYAQDDWAISRKLTLNLGYRYELPLPMVEVHNHWSFLNATLPNPAVSNYPGALQFAGNGPNSCNCRTLVKTHYLAMEPRVGFAYNPTSKIVLRGSFSIIHFLAGALGGGSGNPGQLGYFAAPAFTSPNSGITPAFNWSNGFPSYIHAPFFDPTLNTGYNTSTGPNGGNVTYTDPQHAGRAPYTEFWNLTLQHQLTQATVMSVSYAGTASHLLPLAGGRGIYSNLLDPRYLALGNLLTAQENTSTLAQAQAIIPGISLPYPNFSGSISQMLRPFPQYSGVAYGVADYGDGHYHSLQVLVQHSMSHGLFVHAAYTWSREIDDAGGEHALSGDAVGSRTPYDLRLQRAVSTNPEQVLSLAANYALPFGPGHAFGSRNAFIGDLVGGWRLSFIANYHQGGFFGPFGATCDLPNAGTCYADYNPSFSGPVRINGAYGNGRSRGIPKTAARVPYIDVKAFRNPASFTYGTTPRNGAYGIRDVGGANEDVALDKTITAWRETKLNLKADAFNVFNRTILGGIPTSINSAAFGEVTTQANGPRILQFQAKISF